MVVDTPMNMGGIHRRVASFGCRTNHHGRFGEEANEGNASKPIQDHPNAIFLLAARPKIAESTKRADDWHEADGGLRRIAHQPELISKVTKNCAIIDISKEGDAVPL